MAIAGEKQPHAAHRACHDVATFEKCSDTEAAGATRYNAERQPMVEESESGR